MLNTGVDAGEVASRGVDGHSIRQVTRIPGPSPLCLASGRLSVSRIVGHHDAEG